MVGLGGNNGTTVVGAILANKLKLKWHKRSKEYQANYFGSLTQASTIRIGVSSQDGRDMFIPFSNVLPTVHPNDLVLGVILFLSFFFFFIIIVYQFIRWLGY